MHFYHMFEVQATDEPGTSSLPPTADDWKIAFASSPVNALLPVEAQSHEPSLALKYQGNHPPRIAHEKKMRNAWGKSRRNCKMKESKEA